MNQLLAIDIGGTFTDCVVWDPKTGSMRAHKQLTSPQAPGEAVVEGTRVMLEGADDSDRAAVGAVLHATTLATNAILERRGARVGFLTTEGFRDILIVGREHRYDMHDLFIDLPRPLVERKDIVEVAERTVADGSVTTALDTGQLEAALQQLVDQGVESVAVGFLHSFRNPQNEQAARQAATRMGLKYVSVSHEIAPVIREYDRFSTAVANAYVQPVLDRYLGNLEDQLMELGISAPVVVMLSNGGLATPDDARLQPVRAIESGPAAGVMAATHLAAQLGIPTVLSFDMGGTTAKGCIILDGSPGTSSEAEVARLDRFKPGSGLPLCVPSVDLIEIGAGGGSIAGVDDLGRLFVGPQSASSEPGPACYGRGGTEPTVTDADLTLGYLDPAQFASGAFELDRAAAEEAIRIRIAEPLGVSVMEAAWGIHTAVNQNMAAAFRVHAIERGVDIREYPVVAFGGAGPVHATALAEALGANTVIVPYMSGVFSAVGLIETPPSFEAMKTFQWKLDEMDWDALEAAFVELEAECAARVERASLGGVGGRSERALELRYVGQQRQLLITDPGEGDGDGVTSLRDRLHEAFQDEYQARYAQSIEDVGLEVVNLRLKVIGTPLSSETAVAAQPAGNGAARDGSTRTAYFKPDAPVETPVVAWPALRPGDTVDGPACVGHENTVVVVRPGWHAEVLQGLNLVVRRNKES